MTVNIVNIFGSLVYVIIAVVNSASSSKLPKGFIQCKISDPNFDECVRSATQMAIPHLVNGIPNLGIVKIDPLRVTKLELDQSNGGPVNIKLKFYDLDVHNIKYVQITKTHYDAVNHNFSIEMLNPKSVALDGDYEISGKVLILPIVGKGKCEFLLDLSKIVGSAQLKPVVKNGKTYMEIVTLQWKFTATNFNLHFENLFNGDKALGNNMNIFLNENWRELLAELQPALEDVFAVAYKGIVQQFLNRFTADQIFLE